MAGCTGQAESRKGAFFQAKKKRSYFSYSSMKTYVVGTHQKCLGEALLMSTHNICFHGEIIKLFTSYILLSRAI